MYGDTVSGQGVSTTTQNSPATEDNQTEGSAEIPMINSYRLPNPIPGINVRVLGNASGPFSANTANPVTEPGSSNSEAFAAQLSTFGESNATASYNQGRHNGFENSWQDYTHGELQRRAIAISQTTPRLVGPGSYYGNGTPQQVYPHPAPALQPLGAPAVASPPAYQFMPQAPLNIPVRADTQNASGVGVRPIYPQALPRATPYMHFPQSGASPVVNQHRRHHRTQSLNVNATSPASQNSSHTHVQNSRRRPRHADETGSHNAHRPSPPHLQGPRATATTGEYYQMLTAQQRADITRRLQLGELLRTMHSDEARALQVYEESLRQSRRYHHESDDTEPVSSPPSKGLDNQNDGRPEPKESEELMVNLECKACMSQLVDTVMLPCGHAILCRWCADQHMPSRRADKTRPKGNATCPMCRAPVKQKVRFFI